MFCDQYFAFEDYHFRQDSSTTCVITKMTKKEDCDPPTQINKMFPTLVILTDGFTSMFISEISVLQGQVCFHILIVIVMSYVR